MRYLYLCFLTLLLTACATQWQKTSDENGEKKYRLNVQNNHTFSQTGLINIDTNSLNAGDILFSANRGIISKSIRYLSASPVSHTFIYIGNNQVAEAVGSGVRIISINDSIKDSSILAVYRHPQLTSSHANLLREFAYKHLDKSYNHFGIVKQFPYTITRKVCELPVIPRHTRHLCLNTMALIEISPIKISKSQQYFCSQFVMEGYKYAGLPLSKHNPEWISPADILHMRDDDVSSFVPNIALQYVGHLRYENSLLETPAKLVDVSTVQGVVALQIKDITSRKAIIYNNVNVRNVPQMPVLQESLLTNSYQQIAQGNFNFQ
ncbi:MAG: hypothetical protein IK065_03730 [Neisseriaceae bacterium]|nr:hypothetical protein [Neisseriaceae bacterium]